VVGVTNIPQDPVAEVFSVIAIGTVQAHVVLALQSVWLRILSQAQASVGLTVSAVAKMNMINTKMIYFIIKLMEVSVIFSVDIA